MHLKRRESILFWCLYDFQGKLYKTVRFSESQKGEQTTLEVQKTPSHPTVCLQRVSDSLTAVSSSTFLLKSLHLYPCVCTKYIPDFSSSWKTSHGSSLCQPVTLHVQGCLRVENSCFISGSTAPTQGHPRGGRQLPSSRYLSALIAASQQRDTANGKYPPSCICLAEESRTYSGSLGAFCSLVTSPSFP